MAWDGVLAFSSFRIHSSDISILCIVGERWLCFLFRQNLLVGVAAQTPAFTGVWGFRYGRCLTVT